MSDYLSALSRIGDRAASARESAAARKERGVERFMGSISGIGDYLTSEKDKAQAQENWGAQFDEAKRQFDIQEGQWKQEFDQKLAQFGLDKAAADQAKKEFDAMMAWRWASLNPTAPAETPGWLDDFYEVTGLVSDMFSGRGTYGPDAEYANVFMDPALRDELLTAFETSLSSKPVFGDEGVAAAATALFEMMLAGDFPAEAGGVDAISGAAPKGIRDRLEQAPGGDYQPVPGFGIYSEDLFGNVKKMYEGASMYPEPADAISAPAEALPEAPPSAVEVGAPAGLASSKLETFINEYRPSIMDKQQRDQKMAIQDLLPQLKNVSMSAEDQNMLSSLINDAKTNGTTPEELNLITAFIEELVGVR